MPSLLEKILIEETALINNILSYNNRIVRESIEIRLLEEVINKEDGARLNNGWMPWLESLKASNTAELYEH